MADPESYPDDFDLNAALNRVEDAGRDILTRAYNAQNHTEAEEKAEWITVLREAVNRAEARMKKVEELREDE